MSETTLLKERQACFQLKTNFLPCTTLQILHYDLNQLASQLEATIQKAPTFFVGSPILVDLDGVKDLKSLDFASLKNILVQSNMVPIGVRGGTEEQRMAAAMVGMPALTISKAMSGQNQKEAANDEMVEMPKPKSNQKEGQKSTQKDSSKNHSKSTQATMTDAEANVQVVAQAMARSPRASRVITTPIRSGQQIYAKDADLIVLSSVSVGAELMADGHIHVYGALRGRALAGVQGNTEARIFCRSLEAELVAIAGYYLVKEDIQAASKAASMVQVFLDENEKVKIEAL